MPQQHIWAKSHPMNSATPTEWLPLPQHMADSAATANYIWDHYLPRQSKDLLAAHLGPDARSIIAALAAIHDIGKATPAFTVKSPALAERAHEAGHPVPTTIPHAKKLPHGLAGQIILQQKLNPDRADRSSKQRATALAVAVGGHHGTPPTREELNEARSPALRTARGAQGWETLRDELLSPWMPAITAAPATPVPMEAQTLISAIVIMADWIASNATHFPLLPVTTVPPTGTDWSAAGESRAAAAWKSLLFTDPATPPPLPDDWTDRFSDMFPVPAGTRPNILQQAAVDAVRTAEGPGMLIIEAPMGIGKTEAALLAARILAHCNNSGGIHIALPTRATANAIWPRIHFSMDHLLTDSPDQPLALVHAKRSLYQPAGELPAPTTITHDEACNGKAVSNQWLIGRKRQLLNPYVVSTIDQLLMLGVKQRHVVLRHLGTAGKTVIIDEVHAYDTYMRSLLNTVLSWLAAYKVPVIMLSATLPTPIRNQLTAAYRPGASVSTTGYPSITWIPLSGTPSSTRVPLPGQAARIALHRLADDDYALVRLLERKLVDGGCAAVVCNTVKRAQRTAEVLSAAFGPGVVTVAHSRFTAADRQSVDDDLIARFGRDGKRPERAIVVATQVVEQSLDIDFDLMITDVAPIDLILQRSGRLHRHHRTDRPGPVAEPELYLRGVLNWNSSVPEPVHPTRYVYDRWVLHRTLHTLRGRTSVSLPTDIQPLVADVYDGAPIITADWDTKEVELKALHEKGELAKQQKSRRYDVGPPVPGGTLVGWLADIAPDSWRATRDSEPSVEIILLQRDAAGGVGLFAWQEPVPDLAVVGSVGWDAGRRIAANTISLPVRLLGGTDPDTLVGALTADTPAAVRGHPLTEGIPAVVLDHDGYGMIDGQPIRYTRSNGAEL